MGSCKDYCVIKITKGTLGGNLSAGVYLVGEVPGFIMNLSHYMFVYFYRLGNVYRRRYVLMWYYNKIGLIT